jgi:hypothetical protein
VVARVSGVATLLNLAWTAFLSLGLITMGLLERWWAWALLVVVWSGDLYFSAGPRKFVIPGGQLTLHWWWRPSRTYDLEPLLPFTQEHGLASLLLGHSVLRSAGSRLRIYYRSDLFDNHEELLSALGAALDWGHDRGGPRRMILRWPGWGSGKSRSKEPGGSRRPA